MLMVAALLGVTVLMAAPWMRQGWFIVGLDWLAAYGIYLLLRRRAEAQNNPPDNGRYQTSVVAVLYPQQVEEPEPNLSQKSR